MKHLRTIFFGTALFSACSQLALAQDEKDALRFSLLQPQGTARSMGFGSALGSVGGDFTSLSINPAGIGVYRKSEFMLTPSLTINGVNSSYGSNAAEHDGGGAFNFSNIGYVTTSTPRGNSYNRSNWKAVSFGLGLNRLADFSRNYSYSGINNSNSGSWLFEAYTPQMMQDAETNNATLAYLGYWGGLTDTNTALGSGYYSIVDPGHYPVRQINSVRERGGISEIVLSLGGNYQEKLMIGGTVGIPTVRYLRDRTYSEVDQSGQADFISFDYNETLRTSGAGINMKLGVIYKPVEQFRLGLAVHTPTYFSLTDRFTSTLNGYTHTFGYREAVGAETIYRYNMTTPWRGVVSATAMLGEVGFVTADYEYVDYSSSRLHFDDAASRSYEKEVNNNIRNKYRGTSNVRAGVEVRLQNFMLRGGFGYYGNPYKQSASNDGSRFVGTAGLGYRYRDGFIDLSYMHNTSKSSEQPYVLPEVYDAGKYPVSTSKMKTNVGRVALTLGFKF